MSAEAPVDLMLTVDAILDRTLEDCSFPIAQSYPDQLHRRMLGIHPDSSRIGKDTAPLDPYDRRAHYLVNGDTFAGLQSEKPCQKWQLHFIDTTCADSPQQYLFGAAERLKQRFISSVAVSGSGRLRCYGGSDSVVVASNNSKRMDAVQIPSVSRRKNARPQTSSLLRYSKDVMYSKRVNSRNTAVKFINDRTLLSTCLDGSVFMHNIAQGHMNTLHKDSHSVLAADVHQNGTLIGVCGADIKQLDIRSPDQVHTYTGSRSNLAVDDLQDICQSICESDGLQTHASREWRSRAVYHETSTFRFKEAARVQTAGTTSMSVGQFLATREGLRADGADLSRVTSNYVDGNVYWLAFEKEFGLISGGIDGLARVWDVRMGRCVRALPTQFPDSTLAMESLTIEQRQQHKIHQKHTKPDAALVNQVLCVRSSGTGVDDLQLVALLNNGTGVAQSETATNAFKFPPQRLGLYPQNVAGGHAVAQIPIPTVLLPQMRCTILEDELYIPYGAGIGVWDLHKLFHTNELVHDQVIPPRYALKYSASAGAEDLICVEARVGSSGKQQLFAGGTMGSVYHFTKEDLDLTQEEGGKDEVVT